MLRTCPIQFFLEPVPMNPKEGTDQLSKVTLSTNIFSGDLLGDIIKMLLFFNQQIPWYVN